MSKNKILALCAGSIFTQLAVMPAYAQIEEVVVTARKTSESLQDVPMSITSLSAEQLERRDFTNLEDIANSTPGFNYSAGLSSGYQGSPTIRGLRQGFTQSRVQNSRGVLEFPRLADNRRFAKTVRLLGLDP